VAVVNLSIQLPARRSYLLTLLEALVAVNRLELREIGPRAPALYKAGVKYTREKRDPSTGMPREEWLTIRQIFERKHADCEDLAAARVAELRNRGVNARIWLVRHGRMWHVQVRLPDGTIEDPSRILGMRDPRLPPSDAGANA